MIPSDLATSVRLLTQSGVVDHQTGEEYDLLKEDTGWFDAEFKFDV